MGTFNGAFSSLNAGNPTLSEVEIFKKAGEVKSKIREKSLNIALLGPTFGSNIEFRVYSGPNFETGLKLLKTLAEDLGVNYVVTPAEVLGIKHEVSSDIFTLVLNDMVIAHTFRIGWCQ